MSSKLEQATAEIERRKRLAIAEEEATNRGQGVKPLTRNEKISQMRDDMSTPEAWATDIGYQFQKVPPNLRRAATWGDNPDAMAEVEGIEDKIDMLRTAHPSAVFAGDVALPATLAGATMRLPTKPAIITGALEAAGLSPSDVDPKLMALLSGIAPFILQAGREFTEVGGDLLHNAYKKATSVMDATPEQQAARSIGRYSDEVGIDPNDILRQREALGEGSTLADVPEMRGLAQGSALTPSGRTYAPEFEARQLAQEGRILESLERITGKRPGDFSSGLDSFIRQRSESAKPLYDDAYSFVIDMTDESYAPQLTALTKRLKSSGALSNAKKMSDIEGTDFIDFNGSNMRFQDFDYAKRSLDDLIGKAQVAGERSKARALTNLKNELVDQLDIINPPYALARSQFAGDSAIINAMELGSNVFNPKVMKKALTMDELSSYVSKMGVDEMEAFQQGVVKAIDNKLSKIPDTADNARRLWNTRDIRERIKLAFPEPEQFDRFMSDLDKESSFTNTLRDLYQGSQTASRQAGEKSLKGGISNADSVSSISEVLKSAFKGKLTPEGEQEIAKLLFDKNTTNDQIRLAFKNAGIMPEGMRDRTIKTIKDNWFDIWQKISYIEPKAVSSATSAVLPKTSSEKDQQQ